MIHIDLVQYSKDVLDNASAIAKPYYEPVQAKLLESIERVNVTVKALKQALKEKSSATAKYTKEEMGITSPLCSVFFFFFFT